MKYNYDEVNKKIVFNLDEDIDMESCKTLRTIVDGYLIKYSPKVCEIDLSRVKFMDSSGLGFLMGRYNLAKMMDCNFLIKNPDISIRKILELYQDGKKIKVI